MTSVTGDTDNPITEKNINAARPKASAGRTRGDMNRLSSTRAFQEADRAIASDAATPSTTESPVVQAATLRLLAAAKCNCHASKRAAYQRNEYPVGGNFSEKPDVNETITTTRVGRTSSRKHSAASSQIVA